VTWNPQHTLHDPEYIRVHSPRTEESTDRRYGRWDITGRRRGVGHPFPAGGAGGVAVRTETVPLWREGRRVAVHTRFRNSIDDPRTQGPSNGGTSPQNHVNIASRVDKTAPGIYDFLHQGATLEQDVIIFPWRVEQIANDDAIGPSADAGKAAV